MVSSTTSFNSAFTPDDFGQLLITTASKASVALATTNLVVTDANEFRIPILSGEVTTGWYAENADITLDDPDTTEEVIRPRKVAALTKASVELADDSSPEAGRVVGDSIARSIATSIDVAFFGSANGTSNETPKGLGALSTGLVAVDAIGTWADTDPFIEAAYGVEANGASITAWVANPADAEELAKLKVDATSNLPLLAPDANSATRRSISGIPLYVSSAVAAGTVWGYDRSRVYSVIRRNATIDVDRSYYFGSYSVAVRGVARVAFGYPQAGAIAKLTLA